MSGQILRPTVLERLAITLARPVEQRLRERASWHLLDWLGCASAAASRDVGRIVARIPARGTARDAFVWGSLGNVLEMDDVDKRALLHPGPTVVPVVLSLARELQPTPAEALDAVVRGYEATIRLGRAVGPSHYAVFHSTGTCGPIGAAAAASSMLGLSPETTAHAMALAVSQAAGLWQTRHEPESMGKQLHTAHASRAGLESAKLAKDGMMGPLSVLEGAQGFFAAMCPGADAEMVLAPEGLGRILDVSFKPWPVCRHAHAAIDAALQLRGGSGWQSAPAIEVGTYRDALTFCDRLHPSTEIEAKFSIQHAVAVTLLHGPPRLGMFTGDALDDRDTKAIRQRINLSVDEGIDQAYPQRFGARIDIGGSVAEITDALGDPENPISLEKLCDKARGLFAEAGRPASTADAIIAAVLALPDTDTTDDVNAVVDEVLP